MKTLRLIPSFVWLLVGVSGCTSLQTLHTTNDQVDRNDREATSIAASIRNAQAMPERETVQVHKNAIWVAQIAIPMPVQIPPELQCHVTFGTADGTTLQAFGEVISKVCNLPVRITPDAVSAISSGTGGTAPMGSMGSLPPSAVAVPPLVGANGATAGDVGAFNSKASGSNVVDLRWDGPLDGALNAITARLGLSWKFTQGVVSIYYLDTKTFTLYSIPTTTDMQSVVSSGTTTAAGTTGGSGGSGGGSSGGGISGSNGSNQSTSVTLKTSVADDVAKAIKSMLTPTVGRMSFSPATGTITVTDTPEVLRLIGDYVTGQNTTLTKQVQLNFKVLTVTITDKNNLGLNWDAVYQNLANNYNLTVKSAFPAEAAATTGGISILNSSSKWSGSQAMVQALAQQGRVSMLTQPSVTTLNMEPVPIQVAKSTAYLAQSQTLLSGGASELAQTTLTPGSVTAGFNMNVMPFILPDDKNMLLQFTIGLSALSGPIRSFESNGSRIELPELEQSIFSQKVRIKSGETLVLSGYEQSSLAGTRQGVGDSRFWAFGGGGSTDNRRQVIVILITPVVQD